MQSKKTYTGINIQYPISQMILNGIKTIETRTYPIPKKFLNKEMAFIETPGKNGKFKARVIAIITFTDCFQYKNKKEFYADIKRHCVSTDSDWAWNDGEKWGWKFKIIYVFKTPIPCTSRGIIYRKNIII